MTRYDFTSDEEYEQAMQLNEMLEEEKYWEEQEYLAEMRKKYEYYDEEFEPDWDEFEEFYGELDCYEEAD